MFNKKQVQKITKSILIGSIIILGTSGVYAFNSPIKSYISNFSASESEIGKLINGFFDNEGYVKPTLLKDASISGNKLSDKTIPGAKIADNTITETQISDSFKARDADKLDGKDSTEFLGKTEKAVDADKLDGKDSTEFLGKTEKAVDADKLDGKDSTEFLGKTEKAVDSDKLDGKDSTAFQIRITGNCSSGEAIKSVNSDGTVTCVATDTLWEQNGSNVYYNAGNVGIGTNNPNERLEVNGEILINNGSTDGAGISFKSSGNTNYQIDNYNGRLRFFQPGVERMTVDSNGKVGIGTTSPTKKLDVNGDIRARNDVYLYDDLRFTRDKAWFIVNGTTRMFIQNNGNIGIGTNNPKTKLHVYGGSDSTVSGKTSGFVTIGNVNSYNISIDNNEIMARNNGHTSNLYIQRDGGKTYFGGDVYATAFIYRSDKRLKKDIHTLKNSLEKINKLRGVRFKWKNDNSREIGLIAQEVEKVYPDLVTTDEKDGLKSVKYGNIVAILIEGVKELYNKVIGNSEEIEKLRVENVELKNRLNSLEKRMEILEEKIKTK